MGDENREAELEAELSALKEQEGVSEADVKKILADVEKGDGDKTEKLEAAVRRVKVRLANAEQKAEPKLEIRAESRVHHKAGLVVDLSPEDQAARRNLK